MYVPQMADPPKENKINMKIQMQLDRIGYTMSLCSINAKKHTCIFTAYPSGEAVTIYRPP